jgi:hypothetical protein
MRRGRLEIATVGFNPNLQLVGSDPAGGGYGLGLWIPAVTGPQKPTNRQLFMLVAKRFNVGQRGRLVGFRQYLTIGAYLPTASTTAFYPLERPVETPTWQYVDGNVLWGIRMIPPESHFLPSALNAEGFAFEYSQTPALLFESVVAGQVIPPYGGSFPGNALTPELSRFFELRCRRWSKPSHCDIPFEGPCDIAFFASVQQTTPGSRQNPPATPAFSTTQGATPEDSFVQTYAGSQYFRIAGSLIFEMEEQAPTGAPKTYRRPGDGDRITRDTTETGDNTMRRSAEDTSEYKACEEGGEQPPKRPATPPHGRESREGLAGLPKDVVSSSEDAIRRISARWRVKRNAQPLPLPERGSGLGALPKDVSDSNSTRVIERLVQRWQKQRADGK